ncbi:hypothetical protein RN607_13030 [Demequina capsici]|uniref:Permease n=1 Tax=Demequina capsici TaxID=3075620 RepID=A0AA96FBF3_9MICO|nr:MULTISPECIES: hypothetical protein [unclassified Demequina]WNM24280.1 hypothetical protein RN606_13095 [Demequina sp. OYTSA14]WNM27108.1 hypothetical protein RN607_13030 [Demequina sp. PMTSA13]
MAPTSRASMTAVAAAVVAGSGYLGARYLALAILVLAVSMGIGWSHLVHMGRQWTTTAIVGGGGALAIVAVAIGRTEPYLRYIVIALAAITVAALIAEVFLPSPRGHVLNAVAGTAAGGAIATAGSAWIAAIRTPGSEDLVVAGAITLAMAAVFSSATRRPGVNVALTFLLGAGAGAGMGFVFTSLSWYGGILVGLLTGASVVLMSELYRREPRPRTRWAGMSSAIAPVLIAGVLVYLAGRLLIG